MLFHFDVWHMQLISNILNVSCCSETLLLNECYQQVYLFLFTDKAFKQRGVIKFAEHFGFTTHCLSEKYQCR